jgi:hypothetical protein
MSDMTFTCFALFEEAILICKFIENTSICRLLLNAMLSRPINAMVRIPNAKPPRGMSNMGILSLKETPKEKPSRQPTTWP